MNNVKKVDFYSSQNIDYRNLIRKKLKELNFCEIKNILREKFRNNTNSLILINICESIYNFIPLLKKTVSKNSDVLIIIRKFRNDYKNYDSILQNFTELNITLEKIVNILDNDKIVAIFLIEEILLKYFNPEIIFENLNKIILESEYTVNFSELDIIYKHSCLVFSEGLKNKNQEINYLLRNEGLINKINKLQYNNPIKYGVKSDLPNQIEYADNISDILNN